MEVVSTILAFACLQSLTQAGTASMKSEEIKRSGDSKGLVADGLLGLNPLLSPRHENQRNLVRNIPGEKRCAGFDDILS